MDNKTIVSGIITRKRDLGSISFFIFRSGNEILKATARKDLLDPAVFDICQKVRIGDFWSISVSIIEDEYFVDDVIECLKNKSSHGDFAQKIEIVQAYSLLLGEIRAFLADNYYIESRLPTIHPGKDKRDIFEVDFFGKKSRLSSSNALYISLYALTMGKTYSIQRIFRAEKSKTTKHLSEFDMLETAAINQPLEDSMKFLEKMVKSIGRKLAIKNHLANTVDSVWFDDDFDFPRIEYSDIEKKYDLQGKGLGHIEREIAGNGPVFITHFPVKIASWTSRLYNQKYTRSFNLLLPGIGEAAEGNEREMSESFWRKKIAAAGVKNQLGWLLDRIPYENSFTGGFGLGLERLAMWFFGVKNIRKIHPVYRDMTFSEFIKKEKK